MARHAQALHSKCQPQNKQTILSTALGFPIGKRVTDYCPILVSEAVGFSQPAFTCSKLTIETLEQGVEYVQS